MKPELSPEALADVQAAARALYEGQLVRWGLTCALEPWGQARAEVVALREQVYRDKLPHMLETGGLEDPDDARGHHFLARRDGVAIAALRLLPPPYEARHIFPDLDSLLTPGYRYLELGRLVGAAHEVGASRVLALHALVWGLDRTSEYDGLLAYARGRAANHFRLLGMEVVAKREDVEGRAESTYTLLLAHLENTAKALGTWA